MSNFIDNFEGEFPRKMIICDDPYRIKMIQCHYLDQTKIFNENRGLIGYVGSYSGEPVAIITGGFGESSTTTVVDSCVKKFGIDTVINVTDCISFDENVPLGQVVIAEHAEGRSDQGHASGRLVEMADFIAKQKAFSTTRTPVYTDDTYYIDNQVKPSNCGRILDFSSAMLYAYCEKHQIEVVSILTISRNEASGVQMDEAERQSRFNTATVLALEILLT